MMLCTRCAALKGGGLDSTDLALHLAGCAGSIKPPSAAGKVSIHVSHILSGRCLAKIDWKSADPSNLTALCYNEVSLALALMAGRSVCSVRACLTAPCPRVRQERGDIITGNTQGLLHVWTN